MHDKDNDSTSASPVHVVDLPGLGMVVTGTISDKPYFASSACPDYARHDEWLQWTIRENERKIKELNAKVDDLAETVCQMRAKLEQLGVST